jgi:hypothetical protein
MELEINSPNQIEGFSELPSNNHMQSDAADAGVMCPGTTEVRRRSRTRKS